jgi:hypothetical protein
MIFFCDENVSLTFSLNQRSRKIISRLFPKSHPVVDIGSAVERA